MPDHGLPGGGCHLNGQRPDLDERYALGIDVVNEAAALALEYFERRGALEVMLKGRQDLVSEADQEVEALIGRRISTSFPQDAFLGEEGGFQAGAAEAGDAEAAGLWVVDPIDGTQPFLSGLGSWGVSIAYVHAGIIEMGFVACPARDELFVGRRGVGSTLNGRSITVGAAARLDDGIVGFGHNPRLGADDIVGLFEQLIRGGAMVHADGSGALSLCYVASGRLTGYVEPHIQSWDCFAGLAIVEAAGGQVNDFMAQGTLLGGGPVVGAARGLYAVLADMLERGRDPGSVNSKA